MNEPSDLYDDEAGVGVSEDELQFFLHFDAIVSIRYIAKDNSYRAFSEGFSKGIVQGIQSHMLHEFDHLGFMFKIVPYAQGKNMAVKHSTSFKSECILLV